MAKLAQGGSLTSPLSSKLLAEATAPVPPQKSEPSGPDVPASVTGLPANRPERRKIKQHPVVQPASVERLTEQMRYQSTKSERTDTDALIQRLSQAGGVKITHSNLMRVCRELLFGVEESLQAELKKVGFEGRPMNEPQAIAFFEERLRAAVYAAIRQTPLKFE